jgi:hypothetical protein
MTTPATPPPPAPVPPELLPCPFCGGPVEYNDMSETEDHGLGLVQCHHVRCRNHNCRGYASYSWESQAQAHEKWNTRAPLPAEPGAGKATAEHEDDEITNHENWQRLKSHRIGEAACAKCYGTGFINTHPGIDEPCPECTKVYHNLFPEHEPTASESSGDVHLANALARIAELEAERDRCGEVINLNISTEFRLRNELAAARTKALAQERLIEGLNVALESEKQAKFRIELAHETDTGLLTAERDAALARAETAERELGECHAAINAKIQGKSITGYLSEQFPATDGHIPLREYFVRLGGCLVSTIATSSPAPVAGKKAETGDGWPIRVEQCGKCNAYVSEWLESELFNGRICHPCERVVALTNRLNRVLGPVKNYEDIFNKGVAPVAVGEKDSAKYMKCRHCGSEFSKSDIDQMKRKSARLTCCGDHLIRHPDYPRIPNSEKDSAGPTPRTDAAPKTYKYRNKETGLIYDSPFGREEWETLVFIEEASCKSIERELTASESLRRKLQTALASARESVFCHRGDSGVQELDALLTPPVAGEGVEG